MKGVMLTCLLAVALLASKSSGASLPGGDNGRPTRRALGEGRFLQQHPLTTPAPQLEALAATPPSQLASQALAPALQATLFTAVPAPEPGASGEGGPGGSGYGR
ncbi:hypothetical protein N2152v2_003664 [Parachlorella kessleri]